MANTERDVPTADAGCEGRPADKGCDIRPADMGRNGLSINAECDARPAEWYRERIDFLSGFALPERVETMRRVAERRTRWMTVCMENTFHAQNASALVRHCEAFGVQDIYTIETLCEFQIHSDIVRGTDKWVDLHRHRSRADGLAALKAAGYRIVATTPHAGDLTPATFDVTRGPFALVFGTEHAGVSEEVVAAADDFLRIPMYGFVESLNVSASAAIIIQALSARLRESTVAWRLCESERLELLLRWMTESIKDAARMLDARFG